MLPVDRPPAAHRSWPPRVVRLGQRAPGGRLCRRVRDGTHRRFLGHRSTHVSASHLDAYPPRDSCWRRGRVAIDGSRPHLSRATTDLLRDEDVLGSSGAATARTPLVGWSGVASSRQNHLVRLLRYPGRGGPHAARATNPPQLKPALRGEIFDGESAGSNPPLAHRRPLASLSGLGRRGGELCARSGRRRQSQQGEPAL